MGVAAVAAARARPLCRRGASHRRRIPDPLISRDEQQDRPGPRRQYVDDRQRRGKTSRRSPPAGAPPKPPSDHRLRDRGRPEADLDHPQRLRDHLHPADRKHEELHRRNRDAHRSPGGRTKTCGSRPMASAANPVQFPHKSATVPGTNLDPKDIDAAGSLLAVADSGGTADRHPDHFRLRDGIQTPRRLAGRRRRPERPDRLLPAIENPRAGGADLAADSLPADRHPRRYRRSIGAAFGSDEAFWFAMSGNDGVARLTQDGQLTLLNGFPGSFLSRGRSRPGRATPSG